MEISKFLSQLLKRAMTPFKILFFCFSPPMSVEAKGEFRSNAFVLKQPDGRIVAIKEFPIT